MWSGAISYCAPTTHVDTHALPEERAELAGCALNSESKLAVFGLDSLGRDKPAIVFLGSSNARDTFFSIAGKHDDITIHNIGLSGSNFSQIDDLIPHILAARPDGRRRDTIIVIGISPANFTPISIRWNGGPSPVRTEGRRMSLLLEPGHGLFDILPSSTVMAVKRAAKPLFELSAQVTHGLDRVRIRLGAVRNTVGLAADDEFEDERQTGDTDLEAYRASHVAQMLDRVGRDTTLPAEQVRALDSVVAAIQAGDAKVLLVSMPIADWFMQSVPWSMDYVALIRNYQNEPTIPVLILDDLVDDGEIEARSYPKKGFAERWAKQVLSRALAVLGSPS